MQEKVNKSMSEINNKLTKNLSRRQFIKICGGVTAASFSTLSTVSLASTKNKVVIVGGGAAGTITARYLLKLNPSLDVSIIEKNKKYASAFMSNQLLSGNWSQDKLSFDYQVLKKLGVKIIYEEVKGLDSAANSVLTVSGKTIQFDKLIVATGAEADVSKLDGLSPEMIKSFAWTNSIDVSNLYKQLKGLKKGAKLLFSIPDGEINGIMAVYERISQIASYLSQHNKTAKIQVIDAREEGELQKRFKQGWQKRYPHMIEIQHQVKTTKIVNATTIFANEKKITADFLNVIPPQKANKLATSLGVIDDSGWCPVHAASFESTKVKNVHIIGDAMKGFKGFRKNALMANSQAKNVAIIIESLLSTNKLPSTLIPLIDSEYSIITKDYAISSTRLFRFENNEWKMVTDEMTAMDASDKQRTREYQYAESWFNNITHEMFS